MSEKTQENQHQAITRVLLVEDNTADARLLRALLNEQPHFEYGMTHVTHLAQALQRLKEESYEVVLLDLSLPDAFGLDTFKRVYSQVHTTPIVVLSGLDDQTMALKAVRAGAQDYFVKGDVTGILLVRSIHYAIERKQAEVALRESELRYKALFEHSNDALLICGLDRKYLMANERAAQLMNCSLEDIIGHYANEFIVEDEHEQMREIMAGLIEGKSFPIYERTFRRKDGSKIPTEVDVSLVRNLNNEPIYIQVAVRDITKRKSAEESLLAERALLTQRVEERTAELRAANAELSRANKLKDEFLATVSHELRTPLSAVLNLSEAMQEGVYGPTTQRQVDTLGRIEQNGRHLLSLINDILDISKIESGKMELDIDPVYISAVCQYSLQMVREMAQAKRIVIHEVIRCTDQTVPADERRLTQILVNLLSNAIKFTPEGGEVGIEVTEEPQIKLLNGIAANQAIQINGSNSINYSRFSSQMTAQKTVRFTVWDTGIGIAPEDQSKLFQPFVQLDSKLSRRYEGTGLGLALVDRLTKLHGGEVSLLSETGKGSRFTIALPKEMFH